MLQGIAFHRLLHCGKSATDHPPPWPARVQVPLKRSRPAAAGKARAGELALSFAAALLWAFAICPVLSCHNEGSFVICCCHCLCCSGCCCFCCGCVVLMLLCCVCCSCVVLLLFLLLMLLLSCVCAWCLSWFCWCCCGSFAVSTALYLQYWCWTTIESLLLA